VPVYFAQRIEGGPVLIAFSSNPTRTIAAQNRGVDRSDRLRLLAVVPGDQESLEELHRAFAYAHVGDGWFAPKPALRRFLRDLRDAGAPELYGQVPLPHRTPRLTDEERQRRSERARRLAAEGRFGGARWGRLGGLASGDRRATNAFLESLRV
jgi:hypothetical protein